MRTTNQGRPARGRPATHLDGLALATLVDRARAVVTTLIDRAAVEVAADNGGVADRAAALTRPVITVASATRTGGKDVSITLGDLAALIELADATATAQAEAEQGGAPFAAVTHVVPDTLRRDGARGEFSGGVTVTGAYVDPWRAGGLLGGRR